MASPDIRVLDKTRQHLAQLTSQLANLQNQVLTSPDPLPSWPSLHAQTLILTSHLETLSKFLQNNSSTLSSTAIYPLPAFPGREHEPLLNQLLSKKLTSDVAEWVDEGREIGEEAALGDEREKEGWGELWKWAALEYNQLGREHEWGVDDEEEESDEDEDDGQEMGGVEEEAKEAVKPLSAEQWLRFMTKGEKPVVRPKG